MTSQGADQKLGRMAYDAYCVQLGNGSPWDELEGRLQDAWISAARTVEAYVYEQENLDD